MSEEFQCHRYQGNKLAVKALSGINIKVQFLFIHTIYFTSEAGRNGSICVSAKRFLCLESTISYCFLVKYSPSFFFIMGQTHWLMLYW